MGLINQAITAAEKERLQKKERLRLEIERDVRVFLARGGRIDILVEPRPHLPGTIDSLDYNMVDALSAWPAHYDQVP